MHPSTAPKRGILGAQSYNKANKLFAFLTQGGIETRENQTQIQFRKSPRNLAPPEHLGVNEFHILYIQAHLNRIRRN